MDYDNFRQMVLGANLKPMKTLEINYLAKAEPKQENLIANALLEARPNQPRVDTALLLRGEGQEVPRIDNYRAFKNALDRFAKDSEFLRANVGDFLSQASETQSVSKIVSIDFDAKYLVSLLKLVNREAGLPCSTLGQLLNFLDAVSRSKNFPTMVKKMLSKAEKSQILKAIQEWVDEEPSHSTKELADKIVQAYS